MPWATMLWRLSSKNTPGMTQAIATKEAVMTIHVSRMFQLMMESVGVGFGGNDFLGKALSEEAL